MEKMRMILLGVGVSLLLFSLQGTSYGAEAPGVTPFVGRLGPAFFSLNSLRQAGACRRGIYLCPDRRQAWRSTMIVVRVSYPSRFLKRW